MTGWLQFDSGGRSRGQSLWACLLNQEVMRERRLSRSHTTYLTLLITSRLCDINEEAFRLGGNYDHQDILRLTYKWISLHQETIEPRYHGIDSYINKLRNILATHQTLRLKLILSIVLRYIVINTSMFAPWFSHLYTTELIFYKAFSTDQTTWFIL